MTVWFNEAKDGAKFASVGISDYSQCSSKIAFDELGIAENDECFQLFMLATKFTDLAKNGDKDFKISADKPQLITFKVKKKDCEVWSSKEGKKVPSTQTRFEKWLCSKLSSLDASKIYCGNFEVEHTMCSLLLEGKLEDAAAEVVESELLKFESVDEPKFIKPEDLSIAAKKEWKSGGSSQKESERIQDRLNFLVQNMKEFSSSVSELKTVADIVAITVENPDSFVVLQLSLSIMGCPNIPKAPKTE